MFLRQVHATPTVFSSPNPILHHVTSGSSQRRNYFPLPDVAPSLDPDGRHGQANGEEQEGVAAEQDSSRQWSECGDCPASSSQPALRLEVERVGPLCSVQRELWGSRVLWELGRRLPWPLHSSQQEASFLNLTLRPAHAQNTLLSFPGRNPVPRVPVALPTEAWRQAIAVTPGLIPDESRRGRIIWTTPIPARAPGWLSAATLGALASGLMPPASSYSSS